MISLYIRGFEGVGMMKDVFQLALVAVFAAVLLVAGQLFTEYRSSRPLDGPAVAEVASQIKTR